MRVEEFTDRELIQERFHGRMDRRRRALRELERRGFVTFRLGGQPVGEESLLGQELLRRRKELRREGRSEEF